MNCNEFEHYIDEGLSGSATSVNHQRFLTHAAVCEICSVQLQRHQQYLAIMNAVQTPDINSASAARILRIAATQGAAQSAQLKQPFVQGFIAASILAVALTLGLDSFTSNSPASQPLALAAGEYDWSQDVTIAITVPHDMDAAQLVLHLPADISIQGYEYLSQVVWPLDLKKGRNTVVLPVNVDDFAEFSEQMILSASLIYKNTQKDFELNVNLDVPQNSSQGWQPVLSAFKKLV